MRHVRTVLNLHVPPGLLYYEGVYSLFEKYVLLYTFPWLDDPPVIPRYGGTGVLPLDGVSRSVKVSLQLNCLSTVPGYRCSWPLTKKQ